MQPKFIQYNKGYGFLSFARKFSENYGKTLMDTATKNSDRCSKNCFKKSSLKVTGDLIENKIADKITSLGKTKSKGKEKEEQEIYVPPEKRQEIIDDLRLF